MQQAVRRLLHGKLNNVCPEQQWEQYRSTVDRTSPNVIEKPQIIDGEW